MSYSYSSSQQSTSILKIGEGIYVTSFDEDDNGKHVRHKKAFSAKKRSEWKEIPYDEAIREWKRVMDQPSLESKHTSISAFQGKRHRSKRQKAKRRSARHSRS